MKPPSKLVIAAVTLCLLFTTASCAPSAMPPPRGDTVDGAAISVTLIPSTEEAEPGEWFEVQVAVEPGNQGISAVEINLTYEPQAMRVGSVGAGPLLGENPLQGILKVDNQTGSLSYSLARVGKTTSPTQPATFAIIKFQILESAEALNVLVFKLNRVGLADENFEDISGIEINAGASIKIVD